MPKTAPKRWNILTFNYFSPSSTWMSLFRRWDCERARFATDFDEICYEMKELSSLSSLGINLQKKLFQRTHVSRLNELFYAVIKAEDKTVESCWWKQTTTTEAAKVSWKIDFFIFFHPFTQIKKSRLYPKCDVLTSFSWVAA